MALTAEQQALDYNPELQDVGRQRKLAELLMAQGMQQPQGQMISGRYIAPSFAQQLNPIANILAGQAIGERADTKQAELATALRGRQQQVMKAYAEAKTPQEKFNIGTSEFAPPQLKAAAYEMLKPQKVGEGETISQINMGTGAYESILQGGMKAAPEVRQAMQMLGINKQLDQLSPQELQAVNVKINQLNESKRTSVNVNTGQKGLDNTLKLRSDFRSEPVYKDFQAIDGAYRQINKSLDAGTAAGDLAASTKLMKLLDPTSVVRESELAMAMQATGKLDQLYNYANKIATGQFLSPKQKGEFRTLATEFYNSAGEQYNAKRGEYAGIAARNELNVPDVVGEEVKLKPSLGKTTDIKGTPAPLGVPQNVWNVMTPQEKALFK
jgi:hypothetical protein